VATTRAACYVKERHTQGDVVVTNSCYMLCEKGGTHKETWWQQLELHVM
jgi:hypothetical protein